MTYFKRRNFIKTLALTSAATLVGKSGLATEIIDRPASKGQSTFAFLTAPYLQNRTQDGVTVCWITSGPAFSHVEYWPAEDPAKVQVARTVKNGLVLANNTINKIRVEGLQSNTSYGYRVVSKEIVKFEAYAKAFGATLSSDKFSFDTVNPSSPTASLLVLNDVHDRPHSFEVLERLYGSKQYEDVILNGDTFDYQTGEKQLIDHLINPCTALFASQKPFMLMRGNHETRGAFSYAMDDYFESIDKRAYFSFVRGPVFFVALDTGEDKPDGDDAYYGMAQFDPFREEQAKWLSEELNSEAAKKALYRVVIMHIPPFHSGDWHGAMHCRKVFHPVLENQNVDLVISGHTHRPGIHQTQAEHSYPIIIGAGPKEGQRTIIKVEADQSKLEANLIQETGETLGSVRLDPQRHV